MPASTPKPGEAGYGTAPEGSLSEERAKKAAVWVEKEVFKLLGEIESLGRTNGNEVQVTFGELFLHYQDVSDTLVGILARAKKRGLLKYEGEGGQMLFQGKHDHVVITLDKAKTAAWRKEYLAASASGAMEVPHAAPPKKLTVKEQYEEEKRKKAGASTPASHHSAPAKIVEPPAKPVVVETPSKPVDIPSKPVGVFKAVEVFKPVIVETPKPIEVTPPPPAKVEAAPAASATGFLASMMNRLLTSPPPETKELEPTPTTTIQTPSPVSPPPKEASLPVRTKDPSPSVNKEPSENARATQLIMNHVAKLTSAESPQQHHHTNHHHAAAFPQRTRDGTRGVVLKSSSPTAPRVKSVSALVATSPVVKSTPLAASPPAVQSATLKKETQEAWANKHISRGVVIATKASTASSSTASTTSSSSSTGGTKPSAYDKLAKFADPKHKSVPVSSASTASQNVSKKTDLFEKSKQSSTMPTGLQKRFAWE